MEIVYCVDCGKKLREHDFVRGAAYTREKRHYCTNCRPLDPQAPAPKPKSTRSLPAVPPSKSNSRTLLAAAGAVIVLGAIIAAVAFSGKAPAPAAEEAEAAKREATARDAFQRAKLFESASPQDLEGRVHAWQKAVPLCDRTPLAREARQSFDRAVAARDTERARLEAAKKALGPPPAATWTFETLSGVVSRPGADQADGLVGKALRLDGKSFLRIDDADLFNAPDLTVSMWIKPSRVKGRQGLLSKRTDSKQSPLVLSLWEGALAFEAADESTDWPFQIKSVAIVKADVWTHVAVVARAGKGVELYLNGALLQDFKIDKRRCRNTDPLFVGREMYNGSDAHDGTAYYAGLIDELKVWAQPLTAAEIKAHYDEAAPR